MKTIIYNSLIIILKIYILIYSNCNSSHVLSYLFNLQYKHYENFTKYNYITCVYILILFNNIKKWLT